MKCTNCGGDMVEQNILYCVCDSPTHVRIRNVPALVCGQCGDKAFTDATIEIFEQIRDGLHQPAGYEYVQYYDFRLLKLAPSHVEEGCAARNVGTHLPPARTSPV